MPQDEMIVQPEGIPENSPDQSAGKLINDQLEIQRIIQDTQVNLRNAMELFKVVSAVPTHTPKNVYEQFVLYVNGTTYRFYWYDTTNNAWRDSSATPGGDDQEIQFNDGGVLAGAVALKWDKTTDILNITPQTGTDFNIQLAPRAASSNAVGYSAAIVGGNGDGSGNGGGADFAAGIAGATGAGGAANVTGGAGGSTGGAGGAVTIEAGSAAGTNSNGGNVILRAGSKTGSGTAGSILVTNMKIPTSSTDTGTAGAFSWDSNYIYVCTASSTWKKTPLTSGNGRCEVIARVAGGSVSDTTTETNIFSVSIPGGTLGTSGVVVARLYVQQLRAAGASRTVTLRAYYDTDGDGLATDALDTTVLHGVVEYWLYADGATNSQIKFFQVDVNQGGHDTAGSLKRWYNMDKAASAVDSTGAKDMKLTVQFSDANTNTRIDWHGALLYSIAAS